MRQAILASCPLSVPFRQLLKTVLFDVVVRLGDLLIGFLEEEELYKLQFFLEIIIGGGRVETMSKQLPQAGDATGKIYFPNGQAKGK